MKLKKLQLEVLFNLLKGTESQLSLADSRFRDSILNPLATTLQTYYTDRENIYKEFCIKNEAGEPDFLDGDKYQFAKDKVEETNKELLTLGEEEVEVQVDDIEKLQAILEKSTYKPKINESEVIDKLLE